MPEECWYSSPIAEAGSPAVQVWRAADHACFRLRYSDGTEFIVDRTGTDVWATWLDGSTLEDTATYLLGPILGFVLRLRGVTCLHASAVDIGGCAIVFAGPANAGKSTTAAAFCGLGYPVLADDIVALSQDEGGLQVQPAYPQLRLWDDSAELLYGSGDALPRLTPNWDKRALALVGERFQHRRLPLGAVYVLRARGHGTTPHVAPARGREALLMMLANTYVGYLLDADLRVRELEALVRIASAVPIRWIVSPAEGLPVTALCAQILEDLALNRDVERSPWNVGRRTENERRITPNV
jgi:hypothetical protein